MADARQRRPAHPIGWLRLSLLVLCALVTVGAVALAFVAWNRPTTDGATLTYQQVGKLSYHVPTGTTSVYGSTGLVTGEPVYLTVVATLPLTYAYRLRASARTALHGKEQLVAKVSNGHGVVRTVPLQPVTPFQGNTFTTTATLPMPALEAIVGSFDKVGGAGPSVGTYTVSIVPNVAVAGQLGPAPLHTTFDEATTFALSSTALTPGAPSATPVQGTTGKTLPIGHPITSSASGSIRGPSSPPTVLVAGITVAEARLASLALVGLGLCAVALLAAPVLTKRASGRDRLPIAARFASPPVDVEAFPPSAGITVVELSSLDGLLRVARQLECPVLRRHIGARAEYAVVDNGTMYRYGAGQQPFPIGLLDVRADAAAIARADHNGTWPSVVP